MLSIAMYGIIYRSRPGIILFFYPAFCSVYLSISVAFQTDFQASSDLICYPWPGIIFWFSTQHFDNVMHKSRFVIIKKPMVNIFVAYLTTN